MASERAYRRWRRRVRVAQGQEPADTVLAGALVVNVFTQELVAADIAISDGVIAGVGHYPQARERIELPGRVIAPAFIDAHIHIEGTMLWVPQFARAVVPRGTCAVLTDPHEIANVAGLAGIEAMRDAARGLPLRVHWTAPSCVPASALESPGATLDLDAIRTMLAWPECAALGEMMNVPAVLAGEREIFDRIASADGLPRDGHGPDLRGAAVQAYAGAGIHSDHESTTLEEAREKLAAGMFLVLRQGSSEKNALDLLPAVTDATWTRCAFGSDDRDAHDLLHNGHIDDILRTVIAAGLDPIRAITMASWNPARYMRQETLGAIAPGYDANLVVLDDDLDNLTVRETWFEGRRVASEGQCRFNEPSVAVPDALRASVSVAPLTTDALHLHPEEAASAVELVPDQIVTRVLAVTPTVRDGLAVADPSRDLVKLACVERHHATGRVGVGLLSGLGLQRGAMAGSVGHDAHNIMAAGVDDADLLAAIRAVVDMQGGMAVVDGGEVIAALPLPIAGLMSDQPLERIAADYNAVERAARALGATPGSPFGQLAFLGLSVIPAARVTDRGFLRVG